MQHEKAKLVLNHERSAARACGTKSFRPIRGSAGETYRVGGICDLLSQRGALQGYMDAKVMREKVRLCDEGTVRVRESIYSTRTRSDDDQKNP